MNVTVLGAGSWGTTVATLTTALNPTVLWARNPEVAAEINDATTPTPPTSLRHPAPAAAGHRRPRGGASGTPTC